MFKVSESDYSPVWNRRAGQFLQEGHTSALHRDGALLLQHPLLTNFEPRGYCPVQTWN